jgi:hypothetical protein
MAGRIRFKAATALAAHPHTYLVAELPYLQEA